MCYLFTLIYRPGNGSENYSVRDVYYCFKNTHMNKRPESEYPHE